MLIEREFVRLAEGLVHVRRVAGTVSQRPLCMIHMSPLSSRSLEPLMSALREGGFAAPLLAPDTLGNGCSAPPAVSAPDIAYFAGSLLRLLDTLGIEQVDLFGAHTGARIACEFALSYSDRVGRLAIDGITEYPAATRALFKEHYAPRVEPDMFGSQMAWAFHYMRNQFLFFPWFLKDEMHRISKSLPDPATLHEAALDILNNLGSYHYAYNAAFEYPSFTRLAALKVPTMIVNASETLANGRNISVRAVQGGDSPMAEAVIAFLQAN